MKQITAIILIMVSVLAQAQIYSRADIQGIWQGESQYEQGCKKIRDDMGDIIDLKCMDIRDDLYIFKGSFFINFDLEENYEYHYTSYYGFLKNYYVSPITKDSLYDEGVQFIPFDLKANVKTGFPQEFIISDDELYMFWSKYNRIDRLPQSGVLKLYYHSQKDSRNYLSEFLELDVRAVKSKVADVFSKPQYVVNRLPQGTVVRVLGVEQKGGLVPVEYYTDDTKVDTALMTASFLEKPLHATEPLVEASFSCEGIYGGVEKIICSDVHLGLLDQWLGTYYKQAKFLKPKALKKSQRVWLKERNKVLKIKDPYEQKSTLQHLYQERIQFLDKWRG